MNRQKRKKDGFTLVEVIVVIVILGMIAVLFAPRWRKGFSKAKIGLARTRMAVIEGGIERFYLDCGRYPYDSEGLEVLRVPPGDIEEGKWNGPYLKRNDLLDPWDNPYVYVEEGEVNPGSYDLISFGADGRKGGEGENEDIYNE